MCNDIIWDSLSCRVSGLTGVTCMRLTAASDFWAVLPSSRWLLGLGRPGSTGPSAPLASLLPPPAPYMEKPSRSSVIRLPPDSSTRRLVKRAENSWPPLNPRRFYGQEEPPAFFVPRGVWFHSVTVWACVHTVCHVASGQCRARPSPRVLPNTCWLNESAASGDDNRWVSEAGRQSSILQCTSSRRVLLRNVASSGKKEPFTRWFQVEMENSDCMLGVLLHYSGATFWKRQICNE